MSSIAGVTQVTLRGDISTEYDQMNAANFISVKVSWGGSYFSKLIQKLLLNLVLYPQTIIDFYVRTRFCWYEFSIQNSFSDSNALNEQILVASYEN